MAIYEIAPLQIELLMMCRKKLTHIHDTVREEGKKLRKEKCPSGKSADLNGVH